MVDRTDMPRRIFPTPQPIVRPGGTGSPVQTQQSPQKFETLLQAELASQQIRFSKHAALRLQNRQIELKPQDLVRLSQAVDQAASKGARDSLILMNQAAFIVNVPNRMVVTAVDGGSLKQNVFTNIDSAVILD